MCGTPVSFITIVITIYILYQESVAAHSAVTGVLVQVHGWLMCLAWGFLIPVGVVIACFRTVRGMGTWWFHLHRALQILGFLVSLAGLSVGVYLDPDEGGLKWQHKIIGITVNVLALVQVPLPFGQLPSALSE